MNKPSIRVSDIPVYVKCPRMFYLQRVKNYFPKTVIKRMSNGTKSHKVFEKKIREDYEKRPLPVKGEAYELIIQEKLLHCNIFNLHGKPDLVVIKGTSYCMNDDKRSLLIIDKKTKYRQEYDYQLWGYAYLAQVDKVFSKHRPFSISTGFAFKQDYDHIRLFKKEHLYSFISKLHELRKEYDKMLKGSVPVLNKSDKCIKCPFRDKCFNTL